MKKLIIKFVIFIWIFPLTTTTINAEEEIKTKANYLETLPVRDPFEPQTPVRIIEMPVVQNTTSNLGNQTGQNNIEPEAIEEEEAIVDLSHLQFNIAGIIWDTDRPQAIINNRVVDQGDKLPNGAEVVSIDQTEIKVVYNGYEVVIPL